MFIDFRDQPAGQDIDVDLCIIGAGAAGISIARALIGSGVDVCLLETGGFDSETELNDLARTTLQDGDYLTNGCRLRFFGGSTNHWGGHNIPLNAVDFEQRSWVEHSGWPLSRSELEPWYAQANQTLLAGAYAYNPAEFPTADWPYPELDLELLQDIYWRLTPNPTGFANHYKQELDSATNVRVYLHATVTAMHASGDGAHVSRASIKDTRGNQATVTARRFVVAAGAMESSRLLLNSNDVNPAGLGNNHDQLGRYFMMHPHLDIGRVAGLKPQLQTLFDSHVINGIEIAPGISPSSQAQRDEGILNSAIMLQGLRNDDSGYAAMNKLRKAIVQRYWAWRMDAEDAELPPEAGEWAWKALTDIDSVIVGLWNKQQDDGFGGETVGGMANIYVQAEQAPNPNSRITLSNDLDGLGVPRMNVDCQVLPIDKKTLRVTGELLGRQLGLLNGGRVQLDDWLLDDRVPWDRSMWGGCHHVGTARMSDTVTRGMVNTDCRLHDVDNVYVASSAVFPTSGYANPTITIVALALRLAEHLRTASG